MSDAAVEDAGDAGVIAIDEETAAAIAATTAMLERPLASSRSDQRDTELRALVAASGAPLRLESASDGACKMVAARDIAPGEVLLDEVAVAWFLCRAPGADGLMTMLDTRTDAVLTTLPPWTLLRTMRDSLTLAPEYAARAEEAFSLLTLLSAYDSFDHVAAGWADVPSIAPGVAYNSDNAIPPRAQLLQAIAQCNSFNASLPRDDSAWKRALLWPALCRLRVPSDRERLFDDAEPLADVSALFVLGALFNHSCAPNMRYTCRWIEGAGAPTLRFFADRAVAAGEELTHSYVDPSLPCAERRRGLLLTYRFRCHCAACTRDMAAGSGSGGCSSGGSASAEVPPPGADPLDSYFPLGVGLAGTRAFFRGGGQYPAEEEVEEEAPPPESRSE